MKLASRIRLLIASFVLVVVLVSALSIYYLNSIRKNAESVFARNYEMLHESRSFDKLTDLLKLDLALYYGDDESIRRSSLDSMQVRLKQLEEILAAQNFLAAGNVLEEGMVQSIDHRLDSLRKQINAIEGSDSFELAPFQSGIESLQQLNNRLISYQERDVFSRYERTKKSVSRVTFYMSLIGGNFVIIAIILYILFPGYIVEPVKELTERIRAIAEKDFSQRIEMSKTDEYAVLAEAFNEMASRLDHYEHLNVSEILKEKQRTETIINNLNEAVIVTDEEDKVIWVNNSAVALLGISRQDMISKHFPDIRPMNIILDSYNKPEKKEKADIQELFNTTAIVDGRKKYYHKEVISIGRYGSGKVILYYDITPFKELDQAKTNFMATLSHQFKTPISASSISINLLQNEKVGTLNPEQRKLVDTVRSHNQRLLGMVNELLDVSQIETGNIRLKMHPIRPVDLAEHSLFTIKNMLDERNLKVLKKFQVQDKLVEADKEKLTWVLNNILLNAVRFSPLNGRLEFKIREETEGTVFFSITDQGPGIGREDQEKIFERYESHNADERSGSGLGLSIAKDIIEAHRGRIGVISEPGKGSTFYFTLPLKIQEHKKD